MMIYAREAVDQLTVKCRRGDLGTDAALITLYPNGVKITFGQPSMLGGVTETASEMISYADAPELRNLYSLRGWDVSEVSALISGLESASPQETQ